MTVKRSVIRPVIFSPIRTPTTLYKGGGASIPATAIRQRNADVIRDRAGNTIQVRS